MKKTNKFFQKLLDIIFPRKCMCCGDIFAFNSQVHGVCDMCMKIYKKPMGNKCVQCGREISDNHKHCYSCIKYKNGKLSNDSEFYFENNFPIFIYDDTTKISIFELKYNKKMHTIEGFKRIIESRISEYDFSKIDLVMPVPMHKKKEKERGFNQAKIFAKIISDCSGVPYNDTSIIRTKNTTVQSNKSLQKRYENLEDCFSVVNSDNIKDKVILLVDDIFTSGSTINMSSKELVKKGAKTVFSMTISITSEKYDD